jgi:hypothetical protein
LIDFVFTIDYEIFGNGTGRLDELVYEPARQLKDLFQKHGARFVVFVEAAEFEKIETYGTDPAIDSVKKQIREFYTDDFEIALHLHPQWSNARYEQGQWRLDLTEYNLCVLPKVRISEIVDASVGYLRSVVGQPGFTPLSFRAGNWLFQPTKTAASVLAEKGIKIDSSVFKGGLQRKNNLDYRGSLKNGYYWPFSEDVNEPDPKGPWLEVPIHSEMVAPWKMATAKRMAYKNQYGVTSQSTGSKLIRGLDFLRFRYPLKLDFCRMTLQEMISMMDRVIQQDRKDPEIYRPIISIGHTKDLSDFAAVDSLLSFLKANQIEVSTFNEAFSRLSAGVAH